MLLVSGVDYKGLCSICPLFESAAADTTRAQLAAGMACKVAEGLRVWCKQRAQVVVVQTACSELCPVTDNAELLPRLATDTLGRTDAMRLSSQLLSGHVTHSDWVLKSKDGTLVARTEKTRKRPQIVCSSQLLEAQVESRSDVEEEEVDVDESLQEGDDGSDAMECAHTAAEDDDGDDSDGFSVFSDTQIWNDQEFLGGASAEDIGQ